VLSLSTRGEYGVRAMFEIAREYERGPVSIREIARRQGVSVPYLEQLLNRLRRAGLIRSQKGPGGGYVLLKRPDEITIGVILRVLEGPVTLTNCLAPVSDRHRCGLVKKCVARLLWQSLGEKIEEFLEGITLQDLLSASVDLEGKERGLKMAR